MSANEQFLARMLLRLNEANGKEVNYFTTVYPIQGEDLETLLTVAEPNRTVPVECEACAGTGDLTCDQCNGLGEREEGKDCLVCFGAGEERCKACGGEGYIDVPVAKAST